MSGSGGTPCRRAAKRVETDCAIGQLSAWARHDNARVYSVARNGGTGLPPCKEGMASGEGCGDDTPELTRFRSFVPSNVIRLIMSQIKNKIKLSSKGDTFGMLQSASLLTGILGLFGYLFTGRWFAHLF